MQKMLTAPQIKTMKRNAARKADDWCYPAVKLFCPWGGATWLLTELAADNDTAFGLCDLGHGEPELGYVSLAELRRLRGPGGLYIERDIYFKADRTLSAYAREAREAGRIVA